MKKNLIDLTGQQFSELTVIAEHPERSSHGQRLWNCVCSCGKKRTVLHQSLKSGNTKTCGDHPKNHHELSDCGTYYLIDVSTAGFPNTFTKVSIQDLDKVLNFKKGRGGRLKWIAYNNHHGRWGTYVSATDRKTKLHRYILDLSDPDLIVDHINGDTLDNRRCNIKVITRAENNKNMRKKINNTSGCTGVWFKKSSGLYIAEIQIRNIKIHIGSYDTLSDANIAYRAAAKVLGFSERHGL